MFGHKEGNTGLQSLPDGEAIHHRNRPPFAAVARLHEGHQCSPNKMEPVPSGVPIQDCVSIRSVKHKCRWPLSSRLVASNMFDAGEGGRDVKEQSVMIMCECHY